MSLRFVQYQYQCRLHFARWMQTAIALIVLGAISFAQDSPHSVSVSARRAYITSARLFYQQGTSTPDADGVELKGLTGYGVDFRYPLYSLDISLSLSVDFISATSEATISLEGLPGRHSIREGIDFIPIELSALAYIPIGLDPFRVTMSGGVGTYVAKQVLTVDGIEAEASSTTGAYGIHIGLGFEYRFWERVSVVADVRFRDPDVTTESTSPFIPGSIRSRVNVNGMAVSLGVMVRLFE